MTQNASKVLILSREFPPKAGGAGTYAYNLASALGRHGCRVTVLTSSFARDHYLEMLIDTQLQEKHDIQVIRARHVAKVYLLKLALLCKTQLRTGSYDFLIVADSGAQKAAAFFMRRFDLPTWTVFHGSEIVNYFKNQSRLFKAFGGPRLVSRFLRKTQGCIAISNFLLETIVSELPWLKGKSHVVPHGIDTDLFRTRQENQAEARLALGLPPTGKIIISASRLVPEKGQDTLIRMLTSLDLPDSRPFLLIAGEGPHEPALKDLAKQLGIEDRVIFVGRLQQAQMALYYRACDLFVQLSRIPGESFGLVHLEANACGLATVGIDVGGVGESIENRRSGILLQAGDDATQKIRSILEDDALRETLAANGRLRVEHRFSLDAMAINTIELMLAETL